MTIVNSEPFSQEWITLQNNYEQYEKSALLIKLAALALYFVGAVFTLNAALVCFVVLILWVQEGVFRTSQARLGLRILAVEQALKQAGKSADVAFQLHSIWLAGRKGITGLLAEYAASMFKPTVAFPYAVFLLALLLCRYF
ncbi:MAG: hypothetical protein ABL885_07235 [Methylophilaceae bacterium]